MGTYQSKVFTSGTDKTNVICPPAQVFIKEEFDFLLTIGGHLANDKVEYQKLMQLLKQLGENQLYIAENFGATGTERNVPFEASIAVDSTFDQFKAVVDQFDSGLGWSINHFFIFGDVASWGIYKSEYPTINIIGCSPDLTAGFQYAYSIEGNGLDELEEFLQQEFAWKPEHRQQLIESYKL
ncbi:hypothetical protein ACFQ4C_30080 [Larkinella insperata]|uniref:Uncharacterized protein n=1 Tax=Larkinella insperata TaxID=332158 RepID=A0ABW3QLM3_9BACT